MTDYHINVFYSEEDGGYVADIPDFETCSAVGASPEEALAEVAKARDAWLATAREAGKPIPEPRYRPAIYAESRRTKRVNATEGAHGVPPPVPPRRTPHPPVKGRRLESHQS